MRRHPDESVNHPESTGHQARQARGSTRRQFAQTIAALAVTPLLRSKPTFASTAAAPEDLLAMIPAAVQAQAQTPPTLPEAEALAEVTRILYGKNLTDEQMAEVKRSLSNRFRASEDMKKTKVANGDEPAFIFSANPQ